MAEPVAGQPQQQQQGPTKVYAFFRANDVADVFTNKIGDLQHLGFRLAQKRATDFDTTTTEWTFHGDEDTTGCWKPTGQVSWQHVEKCAVIKDAIDLPPNGRLPRETLAKIWNRMGLLHIPAGNFAVFPYEGEVRLGRVCGFGRGSGIIFQLKPTEAEDPADVRRATIPMEHIFGPLFWERWGGDWRRGRGVTGEDQIPQEFLVNMQAKARLLHNPPSFNDILAPPAQNPPPAPPVTNVGGQVNASLDTWSQPVEAGHGVGDRVKFTVLINGQPRPGHPVWGTFVQRGQHVRVDGDHVDQIWPPAGVTSRGELVTFTIHAQEKAKTSTASVDSWAVDATKFNPEIIATWGCLVYNVDPILVHSTIMQHCRSYAAENNVPQYLMAQGTLLHETMSYLADFMAEVAKLDPDQFDWRTDAVYQNRGFKLQQAWRVRMYEATGRVPGIARFMPKDDALQGLTDDLSKFLLDKRKEDAKKMDHPRREPRGGGDGRGGGYGGRGGGRGGYGARCYECHGYGHLANACPVRQARKQQPDGSPQGPATQPPTVTRAPRACSYCRMSNHDDANCFRNPQSPAYRPAPQPPQGFRPGGAPNVN